MKWIFCFSFVLLAGLQSVLGQTTDPEFGLKPAPNGCSKEFAAYENSLIVLGNSYSIEGDRIILRYHDIQLLKTIFKDSSDGLAVDVILKEQFSCGKENDLDRSLIFDGRLLKPVYRDELFAGNKAKGDYRFIGEIGKIPSDLSGKELVFSILIINNGMVCKYLLPAPFTSRDYSLQVLPFRFEPPDTVKLRSYGISRSEIVNYRFSSSKIIPDKLPAVQGKGKVHSIHIMAFSSIDGDEKKNAWLDSSRAVFMSVDLKERLKMNPASITLHHGENWGLANYQFRYLGLDSLLVKQKQEVRRLVNDKEIKGVSMEPLLKEQRVCEARIYYETGYNAVNDSVQLLNGNLLHAAVTKNVQLFNKAASLLYLSSGQKSAVFDKGVAEFALSNKEVVAAYSALLSLDVLHHQQEITRFLVEWFQRFGQLSEVGKENLVNLYCLLNNDLLKAWDVASSAMAKVIRPEIVSAQTRTFRNTDLMLNLQLTFIKYYGQVNDTRNAEKCFTFISNYFSGSALSVEGAVQLAAFYNSWGAFQRAAALLAGYHTTDRLNEDGMFLYAENLMLLQTKGLEKVDLPGLQKALEMNRERWCKWMNDYRQNLRNPQIKQLYCARCGEN